MSKLITITHNPGWLLDKEVACIATGEVVKIVSHYKGGEVIEHEIMPHLPSKLIDKDNETEEGFMGELNQPNTFSGDVLFSQDAIEKWGWDVLNDREMIYWLKKGHKVDAALKLNTSDFKRSIAHDFIKRNISRLNNVVEEISRQAITVTDIINETQEALTSHPDSQLNSYLTDCTDQLDQAVKKIERIQLLL